MEIADTEDTVKSYIPITDRYYPQFSVSIKPSTNDINVKELCVPAVLTYFLSLDANGARIRYLEAYSLDRQTNEVKSIKLIEDE